MAADIEAAALRVPAASRSSLMGRPESVRRQAEDLYVRRALAAEAEATGLDHEPAVAAQLRQARERILSDARLVALDARATPADDVVAGYARDLYRTNPEKFRAPAQTRARHILISRSDDGKSRERAEGILAQVKAGASFDALAREHSADLATARMGGDLGWFGPGTMVKEFEQAVSALNEPGEVAPLVETQFGFHVVRLEGRRPAGIRPFEEVRPELEAEIRGKAQAEARRTKVRDLLEAATVDAAAIEQLSGNYRKP